MIAFLILITVCLIPVIAVIDFSRKLNTKIPAWKFTLYIIGISVTTALAILFLILLYTNNINQAL